MEEYAQALTEIEGAFGGETPEHVVLRAKASFLSGLQQFEDALSCAESACKLEPNSENLAEKAKAFSGLERSSEAIEAAKSSLALNVCEHAALLVMASANEFTTPETKLYCIKFKATAAPNSLLPGGPRVDGFLGTFWAAADSPGEALEFYRAIDRRALTLELAKHEIVEETVDGRKGLRKVHEGNAYFAVETNLAKRVALHIKSVLYRGRAR
jgi:tetratricopeptide (TPR) repeat protein